MPRKTAEYPDWVMKYKKKGTYINKNGDMYYLYAAHSERIKGTNKVKKMRWQFTTSQKFNEVDSEE